MKAGLVPAALMAINQKRVHETRERNETCEKFQALTGVSSPLTDVHPKHNHGNPAVSENIRVNTSRQALLL
jgi:hypothetical protein